MITKAYCSIPQICQDFKNINTKKLIRNTNYSLQHSSRINKKNDNGAAAALVIQGALSATNQSKPKLDVKDNSSISKSPSFNNINQVENANCTLLGKMSIEGACYDSSEALKQGDVNPSAPSHSSLLFNNEEQSDLVFLVGMDETNVWRFPVHSCVIQEASPLFKDIVCAENSDNNNNLIDKPQVKINWCDPDTFHIILK